MDFGGLIRSIDWNWLETTLARVLAVLLCLRSSMQAMGRKTAPVISSCIELALKIVSAGWLIPRIGFLGTCMTEPVIWVVMMAFLIVAYQVQVRKRFQLEGVAGEARLQQ